MITNNGKDIIAKYLIGQAPAYASFMALGCGPQPLDATDSFGDYSLKNAMDFEMFRVQIISRGYVTEIVDGEEVSKVVLTAELPTEQRYEITEVGIYSAKNNPSAVGRDGRTIYTFTETENWEYHNETFAVGLGPVITSPLYGGTNDGVMNDAPQDETDPANPVWTPFRMSSDNAIFGGLGRQLRYERPRFLNAATLLPGDLSYLEPVTKNGVIEFKIKEEEGFYFGRHIHLEGATLDLSRNAPEDQLKLAFSVINRDENYSNEPETVLIVVEFANDETANSGNYAKFQAEVSSLATNRYRVITKELKDLFKSPTFTWNAVGIAKIYATVIESAEIDSVELTSNVAEITTATIHGKSAGDAVTISGVNATFNGTYVVKEVINANTFTYDRVADDVAPLSTPSTAKASGPSSNFYVALDGMRFENVATVNPLYGLTGYSEIRTLDAKPVVKDANTSNLVEFRFGLDVM
jgi:hypothetical protein